jgi:hypothetical protein
VAPAVREVYAVVRSGVFGLNGPEVDPQRVKAVLCDELDSHELVSYARRAVDEGLWVVFAFEGIGDGERGIDAAAHRDLCLYLATASVPTLTLVQAAHQYRTSETKSYKLV